MISLFSRARSGRGVGRVAGRLVACLAAGLAMAACRSSGPALTEGAYAGPPIEIDRGGETYLLRFHAPTPGWTVTLDRVKPSLGQATLLVTAKRPDPSYMYPQVVVEQEILTTVETTVPVDVYARVLEFASDGKGRGYSFVGESAPE